jgi:parvulin-like peptidyl-prolyl isomerase
MPVKKITKNYWSHYSILIFIIVIFLVISFGIYWGNWHNRLAIGLAKIIPYPAAIVNGQIITVKEFLAQEKNLQYFNKTNDVDPKQILNSIIQTKVLNQLATEFKITVSESEIAQYMNGVVAQLGSPVAIAEVIKKEYGWNDLDAYVQKIIKPMILNQKLEQYWETVSPNKEARQKIQELYIKLKLNPNNFEKLATQYNQDQTAAVAGELGWVTYGDLLPELQKIVITLKPNEFSSIITSNQGYHILKVGQKTTDVNGKEIWQAYQIFFKRHPFSRYLAEQIKKANIMTLIRI